VSGAVASERHLVLVGLMGAGKTSVGRRCAVRLERRFVDTDDVVEAGAGTTVAELFAARGEAEFRALERDAVAKVAASSEPLVVACGGGAVLDADNRRALRATGFVVWLDAPADVLASRLTGDESRPLLAGGDRTATLTRLGDARAAAYEDTAHAVVATAGRTQEEAADEVVRVFREARG
jgi:shikimate kinase